MPSYQFPSRCAEALFLGGAVAIGLIDIFNPSRSEDELPLKKLRDEAITRFALLDARIVHRLGVVQAGDQIVFIAAGAEHRAPALEACRWMIDELKERVPIWKKETTPQGESWVTPHP